MSADAEFEDDIQTKPKLQPMSAITMVLFVLNILAAAGFTFLILMDYQARHQIKKAIFDLDIRFAGLPLDEEKDKPSASQLTDPKVNLSSEELKAAFSSRRTGQTAKAAFQGFEGTLNPVVGPDSFPKDYLNKLFGKVPEGPVKTLEEEVRRLQGNFSETVAAGALKAIQDTKKGATPKDVENAKLKLLEDCLFSLATNRALIYTHPRSPNLPPPKTPPVVYYTIWEQLQNARSAGAGLDSLLEEALKRRVYVRFLRRQQAFRPWTIVPPEDVVPPVNPKAGDPAATSEYLQLNDEQKRLSTKMSDALFLSADPKKVPLSTLEELVNLRFEEALGQQGKVLPVKRDSFEKRLSIAFLLVCVSDLTSSPGGPPVYGEDFMKRTELVLGLRLFAGGLNALAEVIEQEATDRERFVRSDADYFVETHNGRIDELVLMLPKIYGRELDAKRADDARAKAKADYLTTHLPQYTKELKELVVERSETHKLWVNLDTTHRQLFAAQKTRAAAADKNFELLQRIITLEKQLQGK